MTSSRRQRKHVARWEVETRQWPTTTANNLTLSLYQNTDAAVTPYTVGVVLDAGEKPWVQLSSPKAHFDIAI